MSSASRTARPRLTRVRLTAKGQALLRTAERVIGYSNHTRVARAAVRTAAEEIARGRDPVPPDSVPAEEIQEAPMPGSVSVPSRDLELVRRRAAERLGVPDVSASAALEWALATYISVIRAELQRLKAPPSGGVWRIVESKQAAESEQRPPQSGWRIVGRWPR
jgi:hypothetical protein